MSGGSLDYVYSKLDDAIERIGTDKRLQYLAFAEHLKLVREALYAIEWEYSHDTGPEDTKPHLEAVLGDACKKMAMNIRDEALKLLKTKFPQYEFRWTASLGDFPGRDCTIDVFGVPFLEQKVFLREAREVRESLLKLLGSNCLLVFRSGEMLSSE